MFLIEGHTDAVGNDVDNLSLSDRRAEVPHLADAKFHEPPENLTSQGYGEQHLKVQTDGPSATTGASPSATSRRCSTGTGLAAAAPARHRTAALSQRRHQMKMAGSNPGHFCSFRR